MAAWGMLAPGLSPGSHGLPSTGVRDKRSHLGAILQMGPIGDTGSVPMAMPRPRPSALALALTRPLGTDGLPDQEGHGVPQVVAGLGEAPPVPLCAGLLSPVIAVNDLLQPGDRDTMFQGLPADRASEQHGRGAVLRKPAPRVASEGQMRHWTPRNTGVPHRVRPSPAHHPQMGAHPPHFPGESPLSPDSTLCLHITKNDQVRGFWDSGRCRRVGNRVVTPRWATQERQRRRSRRLCGRPSTVLRTPQLLLRGAAHGAPQKPLLRASRAQTERTLQAAPKARARQPAG